MTIEEKDEQKKIKFTLKMRSRDVAGVRGLIKFL
jgi:hypothetical protein